MPLTLLGYDGGYNDGGKSVTVPSGTKLVLVHVSTSEYCSAITLGGVSMHSDRVFYEVSIPVNHGRHSCFYQWEPATGTKTMSITKTAGYMAWTVMFWGGNPDTANTFSAITTTDDQNTTTDRDTTLTDLSLRKGYTIACMASYDDRTYTQDSPQVEVGEYDGSYAGSICAYKPHIATPETMGMTLNTSSWNVMSCFVIFEKSMTQQVLVY